MESNCQKNLPRPKSHLPKNHLRQRLIILLSSVSLLGTGLVFPLQEAKAEATIPLESNLADSLEVPIAAPVAPEQLTAPVLTVPQANIDSEEIIRGMQPPGAIATESPVYPSPVDDFADINDYGLTGHSGSINNPNQNIATPETIVLNERSTGCANVLVNGAVPDQICPTTQLATKPLEVPAPPAMNFPGGLQPVSVLGMEVAPSGFRLANNPRAGSKAAASNFFSRNRPVGRPGTGRGTFMFPLTIPAVITSIFGWRIHPIFGSLRFHSGTDLGADQGTPVIAVTDGKVAAADFMGGYGLTVILRHEEDTHESLYAHLSQIMVQPGEEVSQGTVIGLVGSTGNSTGPHLHFEWRTATNDGWVTVDPTEHLQFALDQFILALSEPESKPLFSGLPKVETEASR